MTLLMIVLISKRSFFTRSLDSLSSLSGLALLIVVACWGTMVVSRGLVYRFTHRNLRLRDGVALDQVNLAATNGLPGGSVVGIAARLRMCTQLGHRPDQAALTVFASGQAFAGGRWICLIGVLLLSLVQRGPTTADLVELTAGVIAIAISIATWAVLTTDSRISQRILQFLEYALTRTSRTKGAFRRARLRSTVHRFRHGAGDLLRERALPLVITGTLSTLFGALILVVVIDDLSATNVSTLDILRAYLLARVATSFVPTPGGVGVLDGALTAGLVTAGVDANAGFTAIVVYRGFTFILPIILGAVISVAWYRRADSKPTQRPDGSDSTTARNDDGSSASMTAAA